MYDPATVVTVPVVVKPAVEATGNDAAGKTVAAVEYVVGTAPMYCTGTVLTPVVPG